MGIFTSAKLVVGEPQDPRGFSLIILCFLKRLSEKPHLQFLHGLYKGLVYIFIGYRSLYFWHLLL